MRLLVLASLVLACCGQLGLAKPAPKHAPLPSRYELLDYDAVANPNAIVVSGNARFTVLTPQLIRIEWSTSGAFEDRPTGEILSPLRSLIDPSMA